MSEWGVAGACITHNYFMDQFEVRFFISLRDFLDRKPCELQRDQLIIIIHCQSNVHS